MTQLNSKLFEIEQNHRDIEGQKALAAALVTALRAGDRETSLMYIPNEKAVDFLVSLCRKPQILLTSLWVTPMLQR